MTRTIIESSNNRFDQIILKFPIIGKILSSLFGLFEVSLLELFRRIDNKFHIYSFGIFNKIFMKGRWGGRVVPLNKNIPLETKYAPTQEILKIIERSNVTGVSWCYCRAIQRATEEPKCNHPLNTCIHVSSGKYLQDIPYKSENLRKVSKEEIIRLLHECDERGLIHQLIFFPNPNFYYVICNCCPCCCTVLKNFLQYGSPKMIKSDFIAKTDFNRCRACKECIEWCHFGARSIKDGKINLNPDICFGCGICVSKCPDEAIKLIKRE